MKKVAYITSGKIGIHRFTYNEIDLLQKNDVEIHLCLTQLNTGPWMPKREWNLYIANKFKSLFAFVILLFKKRNFLNLLLEAKQKNVIRFFFIALSLYEDLKNKNITSIHCQMGDNKLYIGYFLKKLLNRPLTVTVHAHELYQRKVYDDNISIKKLYSYCDSVLTISEFNAKIIEDQFGVSKDKIKIMRLFPDIDQLKYVENKVKILIVANWIEKKGYSVLLKALKKLNRNDFVLWVVGGGIKSDDTIDLPGLISELEMSNKVAILGSQSAPHIDIMFKACDIFCLPSHTDYYADGKPAEREGIPVALMEAMAWGKPVVATNHAGNSELVDEILVEEGNVEQLVEAIEFLLNNPNKWEEMGERNKKIISDKYSKSNIDSLVKVINSF